MKKLNYGVALLLVTAMTGCSSMKKQQPQQTASTGKSTELQTENKNKEAFKRAASLTSGWPQASLIAAKDAIAKYGDPQEQTSDSLIWRNVAPFKRVVVHKEVYSSNFPLLHQNAIEHVVDYKAPLSKVDDIWRFDGSIVLDRTKGEMSAFGESEAMNILALNLSNQIMTGRMSSEHARITYGKETINYLNGKETAYTQVLNFGNQFQTQDPGESVANKIRWVGEPGRAPATKQAQEEKKGGFFGTGTTTNKK